MTDALTKRYESLLFNYETTYRTTYRDAALKADVPTTYRAKLKCPRPPPKPPVDLHSLHPWKDPNVPFDLFHRPTQIIRTDPTKVQERYERLPDLGRDKVRMTRPRVYITPALALDDIEEPTRQMFLDYVYSPESATALKDAVERAKKLNPKDIRAPLPGVYAKARPITLPPYQQPYVSPEWRMDSVPWDREQLRTYAFPTQSFWLNRPLPVCSACKVTAQVAAWRKTHP